MFFKFHVRCIFLHPVTLHNIKQSTATFTLYFVYPFGIRYLTLTNSTKTQKWSVVRRLSYYYCSSRVPGVHYMMKLPQVCSQSFHNGKQQLWQNQLHFQNQTEQKTHTRDVQGEVTDHFAVYVEYTNKRIYKKWA